MYEGIIAKRIKMEGQLKGTHGVLSCIKRIIAVGGGYGHLPFARVLSHLSEWLLFGDSMHASCTGGITEYEVRGS